MQTEDRCYSEMKLQRGCKGMALFVEGLCLPGNGFEAVGGDVFPLQVEEVHQRGDGGYTSAEQPDLLLYGCFPVTQVADAFHRERSLAGSGDDVAGNAGAKCGQLYQFR